MGNSREHLFIVKMETSRPIDRGRARSALTNVLEWIDLEADASRRDDGLHVEKLSVDTRAQY